MRRTLALLAALSVLVVPAVVTGAEAEEPPPEPCGTTTLDGILVENEETGVLECVVPGEEPVVRTEFVTPQEGREDRRVPLTAYYSMADVQLADPESPARGEWADPCQPSPGISSSAFRPAETLVPHLLNAHVRAANAVAEAGSPVLGVPLDFVIGLGDLADNQQYNEIRLIIDILDGDKLVHPDSGAPGYDGVQSADPEGAGGRTLHPWLQEGDEEWPPQRPDRVLDLAQEPFWAVGLRTAIEQIPWYSLPGNHDVKVQGTLPDEATGRDSRDYEWWRALSRAFVIGPQKANDIAPDQRKKLCQAFREGDDELFIEVMAQLFSNPPDSLGTTKLVPPDDERMFLYRNQAIKTERDEELCKLAAAGRPRAQEICESSWVDEHRHTTGIPVGHGYGSDDDHDHLCRDAEGEVLPRACYSFSNGLFHYVALDDNPPEGFEDGNIDVDQFEWLERELVAHSTRYYDEDGDEIENPEGTDKMIVILSHHTTTSMTNTGATGRPISQLGTSPARTGEDLRELLLRFPNVILHSNGHTHRNQIWPRGREEDRDEEMDRPDTGYWEVNTAAIADRPTQSRSLEIADNRDGTLSIFGVIVDALVPGDPTAIDWHAHDHTHELGHAGEPEGAPEADAPEDHSHSHGDDHGHSHSHGDDHGHSHSHDAMQEEAPEVTRNINEDWLAAYGREVGWHDPDRDADAEAKIGNREDRNVELLLPAPEWLTSEPAETVLTYTGDTSGQVGSEANVSAVLTTVDEEPLEGMTITFERGPQSTSAVTDASGTASSKLRITGPPGPSSLQVSFAGVEAHLPAEITVPFEATTGAGGSGGTSGATLSGRMRPI